MDSIGGATVFALSVLEATALLERASRPVTVVFSRPAAAATSGSFRCFAFPLDSFAVCVAEAKAAPLDVTVTADRADSGSKTKDAEYLKFLRFFCLAGSVSVTLNTVRPVRCVVC